METDSLDFLLDELVAARVIQSRQATVQPLSGGVSSDILLVNDGQRTVVVKRALEQLRVAQEWKANISRNRYEQAYMRYVGKLLPRAVPRIYHSDEQRGYFVMAYLGDGYATWKSRLLAGQVQAAHARAAGDLLGRIHGASWGDAAAREVFDSDENFFELRIEPYLLTTARAHGEAAQALEAEADRIAHTHQCLVHGDFSPKNLLVETAGDTNERMVVLDCEVAWFGDAAFDVAFLLNHLMLKAEHLPAVRGALLRCVGTAWEAYAAAVGTEPSEGVAREVARLLPMLMLARIDGKSPVEYIVGEQEKTRVREFSLQQICEPRESIGAVVQAWEQWLGED